MLIKIENLTPEQENALENFIKFTYGKHNVCINPSVGSMYVEQEIEFRLNFIQFENQNYDFNDEYFDEICNSIEFDDFLNLERIDDIIRDCINKVNERKENENE